MLPLLVVLSLPLAAPLLIPPAVAQTEQVAPAPAPRVSRAARPARQRPRTARPAPKLEEPTPIAPLPPLATTVPAPNYELAPVPNRDVQAPRALARDEDRPSFTPGFLPPPNSRRTGTSSITEDDLGSRNAALRELTPGARLRLPFVY
ncbi:flagellar biosynthesis protein FlhF [Roseomonas elaeocarpi]|uniref:Uncharacterized protein n=1 Tax=Roseomonas elaeocarpi TaxID=907779 RepID=A0ABV6JX11_9PROT